MAIILTLREARGNTILWAYRNRRYLYMRLLGQWYRYLFMFWRKSTYNYNCINRIKLESRSRWRVIAIGKWSPEYPSVRCYMYMYMIAQPENPSFLSVALSKKE